MMLGKAMLALPSIPPLVLLCFFVQPLTEAGRIVQTHARGIAALERELEESLQALRNLETGEVIMGASKTTGVYLLPPVIARFRERHPHIALQLVILNSHQVIEHVLGWQVD